MIRTAGAHPTSREICGKFAKGYDLESFVDVEGKQSWTVFYKCERGHQFARSFPKEG